MTKRLGPAFAKAVAPASVIDLGAGRWVVRASRGPALGAAGDVAALGALPLVARELSRRLPDMTFGEHEVGAFAKARAEALMSTATMVPP